MGCSREEDKKLAILFQSTVAEFKGSFILFPVNFLGNCFVNNFYIYKNVCCLFLLSKKLSVTSFWLGTGVLSPSVTRVSVLSLHVDGPCTVSPSLVELLWDPGACPCSFPSQMLSGL